MQSARIRKLATIGLSLLISVGFVSTARGGRGSPACGGATNCAPPSLACAFPDSSESVGPTVIADLPDGVSSDGRGPYIQGTDGIIASGVGNEAALTFWYENKASMKNPRTFTVNFNNPVPGGGLPLGIITESVPASGLITQWSMVGDSVKNLNQIPVGQTVTAAQMNISIHINGRFHVLQMGPQANGHCVTDRNAVHGAKTSSGTIYRASQTKWVMDLPAGSVGRLFDLHAMVPTAKDWETAADKGLYHVHLHYEIGN